MAFGEGSVREVILWEYAKLIADVAVEERVGRAVAERQDARYWRFAHMTFKKLMSGHIEPSSILRENKALVAGDAGCAYCGATDDLHWEHLVPRSRGGPESIDNLVQACRTCNLRKGARDPFEWFAAKDEPIKAIPRIVRGKFLKLLLDEHRRRGTLEMAEFPVGEGMFASNLGRVFELPKSI